eukprot:scaffold18858_cov124-Isochrysis_galbana.AAC.1
MAQLMCARSATAAGADMSRGTPIRSRKYSRHWTSPFARAELEPSSAAAAASTASVPRNSASATCRSAPLTGGSAAGSLTA